MQKQEFRTLRGFFDGDEPDEEHYVAHSATLRILRTIDNLDAITEHLGLQPTACHRIGEKKSPQSPPFRHDMWSYQTPVDEEAPLDQHIQALWAQLKPHKTYLLELKKTLTVDVFLGYRTNCDMAGIEVSYPSLAMFVELQIPFGLSIIVT